MTIVNETRSKKTGEANYRQTIYDAELIPMKEVTALANGGIKIRLFNEDEFGNDSWTEIIFSPEELMVFRKTMLFNDPLV